MELRLLDEVMPLPGLGIMLMSMDDTRGEGLMDMAAGGGMLTDALGRRHRVGSITQQEGVYLLHLPEGDAAYFERLFRKVTVEATLVTIEGIRGGAEA